MADSVITFEETRGEGAQFILGEDGEMSVCAYWHGASEVAYLSKDEARSLAQEILAWANTRDTERTSTKQTRGH